MAGEGKQQTKEDTIGGAQQYEEKMTLREAAVAVGRKADSAGGINSWRKTHQDETKQEHDENMT